MNKIWLLVKVQLLSYVGINQALHSKNPELKRKFRRTALLGVVAFGVFIWMSYFYSQAMLNSLLGTGQEHLAMVIMTVAVSAFCFLIALRQAYGVLFDFKDYDLIMSLPVSAGQVVASRLLLLYSWSFIYSVLLLLPSGVVYGVYVQPRLLFYPIFLVILLIAPLIPMVLSSVLSIAAAALASRFKKSNSLSTVFTFVLLIVIMFGTTTISSRLTGNPDTAGALTDASAFIGRVYPPAALIERALRSYDWISVIAFTGISAAVLAVFCRLYGKAFGRLNTALTTTKAGKKYTHKRLKQSSPTAALFKMELKRYSSTSIYVINTGFGMVLMLIFTVAVAAAGSRAVGQLLDMPELEALLNTVAPLAPSFFIIMSNSACCSISIEGKRLWLARSMPIRERNLFNGKLLVNLALTLPITLLCCCALAFTLGPDPFSLILLFITPAVYCFFTAVMGLAVNLRFPHLNWTSEVAPVKQSAATFIAMLAGFGAVIPPVVLMFTPVGGQPVLAAYTLILAATAALIYRHINHGGIRLFRSLESE